MSHLLIRANSLRIPLADRSVHMCVTSPPYYGLRDYGIEGQLGLEADPWEYVERMVEVFREVYRVLRDDGCLWLNIADCFNAYNGGAGPSSSLSRGPQTTERPSLASGYGLKCKAFKPKDEIPISDMLCFALQMDGWYRRMRIIWSKPNPMPESCTDRPTKSHEYMFLLAKRERYFFDAEAVKLSAIRAGDIPHGTNRGINEYGVKPGWGNGEVPASRNIRSVWNISTESYTGAHFATFPRKLVEPCIKAGTSEKGCCPECGAPWVRIVESERVATRPGESSKVYQKAFRTGEAYINQNGTPNNSQVIGNRDPGRHVTSKATKGWQPTCNHNAAPVPCTVLDPFIGSGTSIVVANALGRRGIGLDLSAEYLRLATQRITRPHAPVPRTNHTDMPLFAGKGEG